jgi:predicted naringenin-chalcone synthase
VALFDRPRMKMKFINDIYLAPVGESWSNDRALVVFEEAIDQLTLDEESRKKLRSFVRFQMIGDRVRRSVVPGMKSTSLPNFSSRAAAFERGAEDAISVLAAQIEQSAAGAGITFDAVITTTSTGNLMPGLSYRMAQRLGSLVRQNSLMIDLSNVGCTGGAKALKLACSLDLPSCNVLVVSVELPTTLIDMTSTVMDVWQGNCTFGDGAAALWISTNIEQGSLALSVDEIHDRQFADRGLNLIHWGYRDYYNFTLADQTQFETDVRLFVSEALKDLGVTWSETPRWAIHPAGITLLMRLSRELGITKESIQPAADHYREHSNMSSASLLFVLKRLAEQAPVGVPINLLTMGAGFNVIYGRTHRLR